VIGDIVEHIFNKGFEVWLRHANFKDSKSAMAHVILTICKYEKGKIWDSSRMITTSDLEHLSKEYFIAQVDAMMSDIDRSIAEYQIVGFEQNG
jgi:hypothetical protein